MRSTRWTRTRHELERLIVAGVVDHEVGLSYSTNANNLALKLATQSDNAAATESIKVKGAPPLPPRTRAATPPASPSSELDDLIER